MGDPVSSGMIGYAIQLLGNQILRRIHVAIRCKKELDEFKLMFLKIETMNVELQEYLKVTSPHHPLPPTVNNWLKELNALLVEASDLALHCTVPSHSHLFSRYRMGRKIRKLTANVDKHLASTPLVVLLLQLDNQQVLEKISARVNSLNLRTPALASTSGDLFSSASSSATSNQKYIEEALIVGQDSASNKLVDLIHSQQHKNLSRFGLVGKGGAGKTLLLKQTFNNNQVQTLFCNGLMLWLTVSQNPSFDALRSDLVKQIALKVDERLESREEHVKTWLNQSMSKYKFALFLDDVWETSESGTSLLEELCVPLLPHHNSNIIIATSRSIPALSKLGVPDPSLIQMQDLTEDDSWRLFSFHAFPQTDGMLPVSIGQEIARRVCKECGGLPLALKVIGHAMAGFTQRDEWEFALLRLQNDLSSTILSRLRLSYDALADVRDHGISLQLCFLYLAAFSEDYVMPSQVATKYWIGEGLVAGSDPMKIGEMYVNLLADRCLIEPVAKDCDGKVQLFRVHDLLNDLAHQIAEKEEKCFLHSGKGFSEFPMENCSRYVRISLMDNNLTRLPKAIRAPYTRSLLLARNHFLTEIPKKVIASMTTLRVIDLSWTALQSLPENMECLKHLVCLRLRAVPIKKLADSVATLKNLQILELSETDITQLPSGISKLTSLKLLDVAFCKHLQCMPYGILHLTSLEYLSTCGSSKIRWNVCGENRLSFSDLGSLSQLKRLGLESNSEIIPGGMLGSMKQMQCLYLSTTTMETLPHEITAMSKLGKLWLDCPQLLEIENSFCEFQHLSYIRFFRCEMLKELPALHKLTSLKHLEIIECHSIEKFPEEFGKGEGFPKLEVFSVVDMTKLKQLPIVEEGALPSLKTFSIMKCEVLQRLPHCYWNLKSVEKIRVYGCSQLQFVMAKDEDFIKAKSKVQTITLSTTEIQALQERHEYMFDTSAYHHYGEHWSNEIFQFLNEINTYCLF